MTFIESIDPFVMQLIIVPLLVIGIGVAFSILVKKVFVGPLITLILNILYEFWYAQYYYPDSEISLTSWNIIFPLMTLFISWLVLSIRKRENNQNLS